jgi:hypothetical protein
VASAPADIAAEVISLAVMAGGIVALAHRAPHVVNHPDRAIDRSSGHDPSSQA